ncbi:MAG: family 20 glycosylhydrolase [Clostridia bacterium]|nr:family 20 glycosylhydrolase [Clostridia bacterium]
MNIIPKAKNFKENGNIEISAEFSADERLIFCKKAFLRMVSKLYGVRMADGDDGIKLVYDEALDKDEYAIKGASVYASDYEGARYGLATMLQLMEKTEDGFNVCDTEIKDSPDKDFRAFMTDLAREWHDFDNLISYVDLCYINKMKYLQLHFADDQSWTLPFACFPKAATKGRCYKRSEIDYLVEYAYEAGVELVPEFEGIGHSKELIKNCPDEFGNVYDEEIEDSSVENSVEAGNVGRVDNIMCIGKTDIFENIRKILSEIAKIFKYSKYIHVGCDEAKHENWNHCALCRDYMARQKLDSTKATYSHFVKKIIDICLSLGRTPIVWEGFPYEGTENISRDAVVISWENIYQSGPELIESGFNVINASWSPMYIVPLRKEPIKTICKWSVISKNWRVHQVQHHWSASKAYGGLELKPKEKVLGGMLCQWECKMEEERDRVILNLPQVSDRTWNAEDFYSGEEFEAAKEKIITLSERLI